ncbi:hypothetical protein PRIPAC_90085, partial [Pristionchus pacificus]
MDDLAIAMDSLSIRNSTSSLERLPSDVVWKIFEYVPESFCDLRLTCRLLRSQMDEYVSLGTVIPLVKEIAYFGAHQRSSSGEPAGKVEIIIVPLPDRGKLFELRYYKLGIPERMKRRRGTDDYVLKLWPQDEHNLSLLRACMGRRIDTVSLVNCAVSEVTATSQLFVECLIGKLKFVKDVLTDDLAKILLNSIIAHRVDQLILDLGCTSTINIVEFLLEVSTHILSLHIYQQSRRGFVDSGAVYLLGAYHIDWAYVILQTFSKKLDKLCIENEYYPNYLGGIYVQILKNLV